MTKWIATTFEDVVDLEQGMAFNKKNNHLMVDSGVPLLRITDLINNQETKFVNSRLVREKFIAKPSDIIYTRTGQVGLVFKGRKGVVHNNCFRVIPKKGIDRNYVYWYLKQPSVIQQAKTLASGAAQPDLNHSSFKSILFSYPDLQCQHKIASILSAYDNLIENNTRRIKILEEMAQAIYREWFVNFRFPGHEKVKMVGSSLGEIPEGWVVGRLDDALVLQRGFDLPKKNRDESGDVRIFAATGHNGMHNEAKVKGPGVVTGRSGSLGTVLYIDEDFWPLNTTLWVKEFKVATPLYAYYLLHGLELQKFNSGAAVPTLNRNDVHGLPTLLPPSTVLEIFDKHILPMFSLLKILSNKNQNLCQTRDQLLPKLISGEVDVSALEIEVKALSA